MKITKNNLLLNLTYLLITYGFMMLVQFYCDYLYIKYGNDNKIKDIFADILVDFDSNKNISKLTNPDYSLIILIIIYILNICKKNNRVIILSETSFIISISFILRMVTIISTIIPSSDINCKYFYYNFEEIKIDIIYYIILRMINLISTCSDKIFSGHIAVATLFILFWRKYIIYNQYIPILLTFFMIIGTIINRNHYTVDVTTSIIINFLLFKYFEKNII